MPRFASAAMNVRMLAHEFVAFEELVDGEVGLHAWDVVERLDAVVGQRHHALVGGVVGALQADHFGTPGRERPPAVEGGAIRSCDGSTSSMEAIRQPRSDVAGRRLAPTPCSRRRIAATAVNSSADSGSSG